MDYKSIYESEERKQLAQRPMICISSRPVFRAPPLLFRLRYVGCFYREYHNRSILALYLNQFTKRFSSK